MKTCFHLGLLKVIQLFQVSLMEAHPVLILALLSHSLQQLRLHST